MTSHSAFSPSLIDPHELDHLPDSPHVFDSSSRELVAASDDTEKQQRLALWERELENILAGNESAESLYPFTGCEALAGTSRSLPGAMDLSLDDRLQFCSNEAVNSQEPGDASVHCIDIDDILEGGCTFEVPPQSKHASLADDVDARSSDLENVLDILLEEAEAVSVQQSPMVDLSPFVCSSPAQSSTNCSSRLDEEDEFSLTDGASHGLSISTQLHDRDPTLISSPSGSLYKKREAWNWQAIACEESAPTLLRSCSDIHRYLSGEKYLFLEPNESIAQQSSAAPSTSSNLLSSQKEALLTWAGPTLLDIESALASRAPSTFTVSSPINAISNSSASSSFSEGPDEGKGCNSVLDDPIRNSEFLSLATRRTSNSDHPKPLSDDELNVKLEAWGGHQKLKSAESKYTVKIRSEEDKANDGYRWRKYGQKIIKNSPYARSYYRCTTGKCIVKKQVERSNVDPNILLVTYEGIHLHHRPNPLAICAPLQIVNNEDIHLHHTSSQHLLTHLSHSPSRNLQELLFPLSSSPKSHST